MATNRNTSARLISLTLSVLLTAQNAFAAATSPGGARVVTAEDIAQRRDKSGAVIGQDVPAEVSSDNWAYLSVAGLQEKYGKEKPLPPGRCSKAELLDAFVDVLGRVVDEFKKKGAQTITRDDVEDMRVLIIAVEDELFHKDAYLTIRGSLERILALVEPPVPVFKYKVGVNGFGRAEGAGNLNMAEQSYDPGHDQGRFVYRLKPFAYWHPVDRLDLHAEGQLYGVTGVKRGDRALFSKGSLYQGYFEARLPNDGFPGVNWLSLKGGRQEFVYGSAFMLGSDTFYDGLTYDAARLRLQPLPTTSLDLLGGNYATPFSGTTRGDLVGAYLSYSPSDDSSVEAYGFRDRGAEDRKAGERLDFYGLRVTGPVGIYAFEVEGVIERGKQYSADEERNLDIQAAGAHADLTGQFKLFGYDNAVFMSVAAGTGDQNPAREFRNPNNDSSLMGDMHVVSDLSGIDVGDHRASGLQIYTLGWAVELTRKLNLSLTGRKIAAASVEEGFSRQVGVETDLNMTYSFNKDYTLIAGYDHFFPGAFVRQASGRAKDADYVFAMLAFNYDWTRRKR